MELCLCHLLVRRLIVMGLLVFRDITKVASQATCSSGLNRFTQVLCYEHLGVTEMDLYNVTEMKSDDCMRNCAKDVNCRSFLADSRYGTCAFYRRKPPNNIPDGSDRNQIYFLNYNTRGSCDSEPEPECYRTDNGHAVYTGRKMTTSSGITCQRFDQQTPHIHFFLVPSRFNVASLSDVENFCRDPDTEGVPWCYTVDPSIRFTSCGIPFCQ